MKQVVPRAPLPPRELPGKLEKTRNTEKCAPGKANQSALGPPLPALARGRTGPGRSGSRFLSCTQKPEGERLAGGAHRAGSLAATAAQGLPGGNPSPAGEEGSCFPPSGTFHLKSFHKGCSRLRLREEL